MKKSTIIILLLIFTSCVPTRVAPRFKNQDYKVMKAKKFQRSLPRTTAFIFKDTKNANEFYDYINTKYKLNDDNVGYNVPFKIEGDTFYLTYYEINIDDKNLNLLGLVVDLKLEEEGYSRLFNEYESRQGHWYLAITIYDDQLKNCLLDNYPHKTKVIDYLTTLKKTYLETQNYQELLLQKKS